MSVRGSVARVDGQRQCLNGSQLQIGNFPNMAFLLAQASQIELVGVVDQVDRGEHQHGAVPSGISVPVVQHGGQRAANQIVRGGPEEVFAPHPEDRLALRK